MANRSGSKHLKKLASSRLLPIARKNFVWYLKVSPGPHNKLESIPLLSLLRDLLHVGRDARETRLLISAGKVLVDGKLVRNATYPVGLMDVVAIPSIKSFYRIVFVNEKLKPIKISEKDATWKYARLENKKFISKDLMQLSFHDGKCLLVKKEDAAKLKPGDSVKLALPPAKLSVQSSIKMEKDALCYVFKGKHSGLLASFVNILERTGSQSNNVALSVDGHELVTLQKYVFPVENSFTLS